MFSCQYCGRADFATVRGVSYHINACHPARNTRGAADPAGLGDVTRAQDPGNQPAENPPPEEEDPLAGIFDAAKLGRQIHHRPTDDGDASVDVILPPEDGESDTYVDFDWRQHVLEPDTVGVPDCVAKLMFEPPENFGSRYLLNTVGTKDSVKFGHNIAGNLTPDLLSGVQLLSLLKGHNLSLFDDIMRWKHQGDEPYSREKILKELQMIYGYDQLYPKNNTDITLPNTGVQVKLIVFPFGQMLLSLLTDPVAMQPENLLFDFEDPFKKPVVGGPDGMMDDFNTGEVHVAAHERYCTKPNHVLCEIVVFLDKTHLDVKGKHTVEPVMFTPCIFNRRYRNQHNAWRPLGYIPNLDLLAPHANAEDKQRDYHFCLRIIMSELVAYQRLGGIDWIFTRGDQMIECSLQIPVNCVIGDTEGHDKLLARKTNRQQGKLCRYCSVSFQNLGNPLHEERTQLTKCTVIRKLRNSLTPEAIGLLEEMGYKKFHDGMVDVLFSDPERGLNGCTPAEILHAFLMGVMERSLESCFGSRKTVTKKRRRLERKIVELVRQIKEQEPKPGSDSEEEEEDSAPEESSSSDDSSDEEAGGLADGGGEVMKAIGDKELGKLYVFNKQAKMRVDQMAKGLHRHLKWQSDRGLPRTSYPSGITKLTKMQGNERTGVALLLLVILISDYWADWRRTNDPVYKKGPKPNDPGYLKRALLQSGVSNPDARFSNIVKTLFLLVAFESFMKLEKVPVQNLDILEKFIARFLDQVLRTFSRSEGAGNNLIKNHILLHLIWDIKRLASCLNVDSGTGESLHKTAAKETGRRTNMSSKTFEEQTGKRYCENLTTNRGYADHPLSVTKKNKSNKQDDPAGAHILGIGRTFLRDSRSKEKNKITDSLPVWKDSFCTSEEIVDLVRQKILPFLKTGTEVSVFTKYRHNGVTYSACPSYGTSGISKQHWALVDMGEYGLVPNHLLCVLHIPEKPSRTIDLGTTKIDQEGYFFVVHTAHEAMRDDGIPAYAQADNGTAMEAHFDEGTRAHADQHLVHIMSKSHQDETGEWIEARRGFPPTLLVISPDSISGQCVGFPNPDKDPKFTEPYEFFFLRPTCEWGSIFESYGVEFMKAKPKKPRKQPRTPHRNVSRKRRKTNNS